MTADAPLRREFPDAPIVAVGAVVVEGGRVLLVRRGQPPLKGEWSLPGGVLELGEALADGVARETLEETGLTVTPQKIVEVVDRIVREDDGRVRYHFVIVDFLCRVRGGTLACASDAEAARWVSREELNGHSIYKVAPAVAAVIEKAFALAESGAKI